ncbi:MAG: hypothetical protein LBR21_03550 [Propionibacteriaceae bacterium]|nr:hypothetical protein [Propionibacteriaceae bacterium]
MKTLRLYVWVSTVLPGKLQRRLAPGELSMGRTAKWRSDAGQGAVEYLGILCAVVLIIAAVIAAAPNIGDAIVSAITSAISKITGTGAQEAYGNGGTTP